MRFAWDMAYVFLLVAVHGTTWWQTTVGMCVTELILPFCGQLEAGHYEDEWEQEDGQKVEVGS